MAAGADGLALYLRLPVTGSVADLLPGTIIAGLGQGVAFTTMYVAAGTGVAAGEQGVASAVASTAQQLGGSVGLAVLVALLSQRAVALGGTGAGPTAQPPGILTGGATRHLRHPGRHRPARRRRGPAGHRSRSAAAGSPSRTR